MTTIRPVLEHPIESPAPASETCRFLARVIEAHPALTPLLDFAEPDPMQIARAVGLLGPDDSEDDLDGIVLGTPEWFEPGAGLTAVHHALRALTAAPESLASALYDPTLRPADVLADLEFLERALLVARQHETRFRLVTGD
ncbi:MAG: hypothetical protein M3Y28_03505 [Armatimonadota bacterium]|nr:hypothetical protein [Armatimonadota bacterium]